MLEVEQSAGAYSGYAHFYEADVTEKAAFAGVFTDSTAFLLFGQFPYRENVVKKRMLRFVVA